MNIRRVVTGHDANGRAIVVHDGMISGAKVIGTAAEFVVPWRTVSAPVDNDDTTDRAGETGGLTQDGGSVLRFVEMPPGARSPLHRTNSLDYGIVLEGDVALELDDGAITPLSPGDVVVQRGTMHAWINRGATPARMVFVPNPRRSRASRSTRRSTARATWRSRGAASFRGRSPSPR